MFLFLKTPRLYCKWSLKNPLSLLASKIALYFCFWKHHVHTANKLHKIPRVVLHIKLYYVFVFENITFIRQTNFKKNPSTLLADKIVLRFCFWKHHVYTANKLYKIPPVFLHVKLHYVFVCETTTFILQMNFKKSFVSSCK